MRVLTRRAGWLVGPWLVSALACAGCSNAGSSGPPEEIDGGAEAAPAPDGGPPGDSSTTPHDAGNKAPDTGTDASGVPGSEGGGGCSTLPLCEGFEEDAPGTPPTDWTVVMGCNPQTMDTATDGGLRVGVDSSQHHSGSHSVRIVGGDSCGYYVVSTSPFASLGTQLWARFWVMFSSGPTPNHNGFLSMATSGGNHLRLGFQSNVVDWNAQTSDSTLPDLSPQGTALSIGTTAATWTSWNCMEFHLDETAGTIDFWFNDSASTVSGLSYDGTVVHNVDDQWSTGAPKPLAPTNLGLGWLGLNAQETVWFDDVALSSTGRIGCN